MNNVLLNLSWQNVGVNKVILLKIFVLGNFLEAGNV